MFWQILAIALMKMIKRIREEIQLFKRKLFLGCFPGQRGFVMVFLCSEVSLLFWQLCL